MIIVYEAVSSLNQIRKRKFVKETNNFYIRENGMRDKKQTDYSKFCKTFYEAKDYLLNQTKENIKHYEKWTEERKKDVIKIENLKEEDCQCDTK